MQLPSVKQMQYLVAVNETQHFGKAAESCFVTQSALSTGIRELENILGVKVFERSRKQITTTPVGEALVEQARHCLLEIGNLVELAERNNKPLSGPLRLGIIPTITPFILPSLLPELRQQFPNIDFFLNENLTGRLFEQLQAGDVDVLLLALPYELPHTEQLILFEDPLMLAFHKDTKLLDANSWEPKEDSMGSLMLLEDGHCLRDHAVRYIASKNENVINPFNATSLSTLIHMIGADLGFSLLPSIAEDSPLLKNSGIRLRDMGGETARTLALVWRESSVRADDYRAIGAAIKSVHDGG